MVATNFGLAGARWDFDLYKGTKPFGLKFGLLQLGARSPFESSSEGYFYTVCGEVGVFGAIKNRTNRLQLFTALDIGESENTIKSANDEETTKDFWFATVVGLQYYLTNIGKNGATLTARFVKPMLNSFVEKPFFEVGFGMSWGGIIKTKDQL